MGTQLSHAELDAAFADNNAHLIRASHIRDLLESSVPSRASLVFAAASTPIAVAGTYVKASNASSLLDGWHRFDAPAANRLRYVGEATVEATVLAALVVTAAAAAQTVAIGLAKNGVLDESSVVRVTAGLAGVGVPVVARAELAEDDYLELWIANLTSDADVSIVAGTLRALAFLT